jgi:quinol-cytochrome oxidoreductase complex cytochrome b subunit
MAVSILMAIPTAHLLRGIWIRLKIVEQNELNNISHRIKLNLIWLSGWVILAASFLSSFIGYILNWGQMSYRGITVMINILSVLPLFGSYIGDYLWCSSLVIVNRMFILHFTLGFIIGSLILCHLALLHNFSSWNPLINNHSSFLISFFLLFFKDAFVSYVIPLFISFYLFWDPDIFSNADSGSSSSSISGSTAINASLAEFLWVEVMLKSIEESIV